MASQVTITIEGMVGSGKTTIAVLLEQFLKSLGVDVTYNNSGFSIKEKERLYQVYKELPNSPIVSPSIVIIEKQLPRVSG